jgi:hypothetical protein
MFMLTLELVSKKRKPIKRNAFFGIIFGILLLILIVLTGQWLANTIKIVVMVLVACIFVICLYIINYSVKFKNAIGLITFSEENIEIEFLQKTEIINIENINSVRFKLTGYEGLNNSTIFDLAMWSPNFFSYHSGINNFVYIYTNTGLRTFEFYIPNKKNWLNINKIAQLYHDRGRI